MYYYKIMKKIFSISIILISIFSTIIYENRQENLLHKFINYALENEDVVFETDLKNTKYVCSFISVYSTHHIKPDLQRIGADYTPMISFRIHTNRKGEASSAIIGVKDDNSLFITYLSAYDLEFTKPINFDESRCIQTNNLHYKIKNKKLYITP